MKPLLDHLSHHSSLGMSILLEQHQRLERIRQTLHHWIAYRHVTLTGSFHVVTIRSMTHKNNPIANLRTNTNTNNNVLIVFSDDAAITSRLKNLKPSLLECLKKYDIGDIHIKTKPIVRSHHQTKRDLPSRAISKSVAKHLLQVCPNTPTGQSLRKLVKNANIKGAVIESF